LVFSALEEVNLVFTLMVSSTVMVDVVFLHVSYAAAFFGDGETLQRYVFHLL